MSVPFLMLSGSGWTQRWRIVPGMEEQVRVQLSQVGTATTSEVAVMDPGSEAEAKLVVAWALVAAAVVLDGSADSGGDDSTGRYA